MVLCHADDDVVAIEQFARKLSLHVPRSIYTELLQSLERPRVDRLRSGSNAGRADIPAGDTVIREILLEALLRSHAPEYISRADEQHALWCFHRPIIRHVGRCGIHCTKFECILKAIPMPTNRTRGARGGSKLPRTLVSFRHCLAEPRQPRKKNTPCISDLAGVKFLLKKERVFFFRGSAFQVFRQVAEQC